MALDSAIIQHPRTWEASGHIAGFTDPLVDCRTCKLRFRADKLEDAQCGQKPSLRPGEGPNCDLTEARNFNLMFQTTVGPVQEEGSTVFLRPGDGPGHLPQLQALPAVRAQEAAVRDRPGRQELPQRDHARQLHLPDARVRADGDGVLRAAGRGRQVVRVLEAGALRLVRATRHPRRPPAPARARRRRAARTTRAAPATSSTCIRSAGRSSRASPTAATSISRSTPSTPARTSSTSIPPAASATSRT